MTEVLASQSARLYILAGVSILLSILLLVSWTARQPPGKFKLYLTQAGIVIAFVALLAMVVTGRLHWVFAAIGACLPIVLRLLPLLRHALVSSPADAQRRRSSRIRNPSSSSNPKDSPNGGEAGRRSRIEARFLRMSIDEETGDMRGVVLKGKFAGAHLSELSLDQLQQLHRRYSRWDAESAALLAAFLESAHEARPETENQRARDSEQTDDRAAPGKPMAREEAYEILGLEREADAQAVIDAHRRLMQKLHPDRGGTNYLAAKINQAKQLLLER
jgi:hypothetical protein